MFGVTLKGVKRLHRHTTGFYRLWFLVKGDIGVGYALNGIYG